MNSCSICDKQGSFDSEAADQLLIKLKDGRLMHKLHLHCFDCRPEHDIEANEDFHLSTGDDTKVLCEFQWILSHRKIDYCFSCKCPILDRLYRDESTAGTWHPECRLIYKSWNIRLAPSGDPYLSSLIHDRHAFMAQLKVTRIKRDRLWRVLSGFEESVAGSISDLLDTVALKRFDKAKVDANHLILHFTILYEGLDQLYDTMAKFDTTFKSGRESKLLAKKVVTFLSLLLEMYILPSPNDKSQVRDESDITKELLSVVTSIAQYLKIVLRSALIVSLKMEREWQHKAATGEFLSKVASLNDSSRALSTQDLLTESCCACRRPIEEPCISFNEKYRWHTACFHCSASGIDISKDLEQARLTESDMKLYSQQCAPLHAKSGFNRVSQISQYQYLLEIALKRFEDAVDSSTVKNTFNIRCKSGDVPLTQPATSVSRNQSLEANMKVQLNSETSFVILNESAAPSRSTTPNSNWPRYSPSLPEPPGDSVDLAPESGSESKYLSQLEPIESVSVNQVSILLLSKLLKETFSINDLSAMVRTRKPSLLAKIFSPRKNSKVLETEKLFGTAISSVLNTEGVYLENGVRIPKFINEIIEQLKGKDLAVEGIFRKNGNIRKMNELQKTIDSNPGNLQCLENENSIQLAAILKKYLRDLPEPLMTFKLYPLFLSVASLENEDEKRQSVHLACCLLPKANRDVLFSISKLMQVVASHSEKNKMDIANLAIVMAPNILYSLKSSQSLTKSESDAVNEIVSLIFEHNDEFALIPHQVPSPSKRALSLSTDSLPPVIKKKK